jgi:hypothetical protein
MRKIARVAAITFLIFGAAWFVGGFILFPDAPIRACGSAYCGKQRQAHTEGDFVHFEIWQTGLKFGWPLVLLAAFFSRPRHPNPYETLNANARKNTQHVEP